MIIDRPQAKLAAKNCIRTARISPYQISTVYVLITLALGTFDQFMIWMFGVPYYMDYYTYVLMPSGINWFISILVSLISMILAAGFTTYCLAIRRGKEMPLSTLFDGFSIVGKVILLQIVMGIFIALWTMLFIIPGFIAMYRYRFALYNLLENPDMGVMEAINLSKQQTLGYKWQLFILDLSFLGWMLLSMFTFGLLLIWLLPYMTMTGLAFYDTICAEKGMTAGGQTGWKQGTPEGATGQYDYDWNHQNSSWNSAPFQEDAPAQNAEPAQPESPEAPQDAEPPMPPTLGEGQIPAAPEPPAPPADKPQNPVQDENPWQRFDQDQK